MGRGLSIKKFKDVVRQLAEDCQNGSFLPYEEADLRAEAYSRIKDILQATTFVVNTEVRYYPYGEGTAADKCDLIVWDAWRPGQGGLSLAERSPAFAVEFKYWGDAPSKMLSAFENDLWRLSELGSPGQRIAFLYVNRRFRAHQQVLAAARGLGVQYNLEVLVVDGTLLW